MAEFHSLTGVNDITITIEPVVGKDVKTREVTPEATLPHVFKVFVPSILAFEDAESKRRKEKEAEQIKKIQIELKIISDSIQNHPGVQNNQPDDTTLLESVCRPFYARGPGHHGVIPIWYIKFSHAVSKEAFDIADVLYNEESGFCLDYAEFDRDGGQHINQPGWKEFHCVIWKRAKK